MAMAMLAATWIAIVDHVRARIERAHADVVHREDAAAHQAGGKRQRSSVNGPELVA